MTRLVGRQREALKLIQELIADPPSRKVTTVALSRRMNISTQYARYLCMYLASHGYISGHPWRGYELTPEGERMLEQQKQFDIFYD